MKDIFEAIERLSAQLSFLTEQVTSRRSLAVQFSGYSVSPRKNLLLRIYHVMVHLPRGYAASFRPRPEVNPDGQSWHVDITRSDGTVRKSWQRGIEIARLADGKFHLVYAGRELNGDDLMTIITDMERPGLSGMAVDISRLFSLRFGHLPHELAACLESIREVDILDRVYDTLLHAGSFEDVERLIKTPAAPEKEAAPVAQEAAAAAPTPAEAPAPAVAAPDSSPAAAMATAPAAPEPAAPSVPAGVTPSPSEAAQTAAEVAPPAPETAAPPATAAEPVSAQAPVETASPSPPTAAESAEAQAPVETASPSPSPPTAAESAEAQAPVDTSAPSPAAAPAEAPPVETPPVETKPSRRRRSSSN